MSEAIQVDFSKGTIKTDVMEIPNKLLDGAFEAIMEAAHLMAGLAQVYVRVETGSLRDSIRVERGGEGKHWREVRVRAGGYITNPKTGKIVDYAVHVELKYPYMKPAWRQVSSQVDDIVRRKCLEEIKTLRSAM